MRQIGWRWLVPVVLLPLGSAASAESTLDVLEQDLNDVKNQHDQASTEVVVNFFNQLDAASRSPDAAIALYQQCGGIMPDPTPLANPGDDNERQDAKATRLAKDQDNLARLGNILQVHCAMMHFAGLFIVKPDTKGLQDDWISWLKSIAQTYPQLRGTGDLMGTPDSTSDSSASDDTPSPDGTQRRRRHHNGSGSSVPIGDWKNMSMHESLISKNLKFHAWGEKEQAKWAVKSIPELYRTAILDPLRANPTADTLAAWDVYIAMKNADHTDADTWANIDYPSLMFERGCDDYSISHSVDKLQALTEIVKTYPTHPKIDDMISRARELLKDYRSRQPANGASTNAAASTDPTTSTNSNVTVTTQGDMTIITKNTNSAPANPTPPAAQ